MKPIYQLFLMLIVSWIATIIKDLIFEKKIYDIALSFGQALVPFAIASIVVLIGFILQWINRPAWKAIIRNAWILLLLALFFMYYGDFSM